VRAVEQRLLAQVERQKDDHGACSMQTPPDDLSYGLYNRAIQSKIGEALRTLFVPAEPPPKRLLELLHALDQSKGDDTGGTEERLGEQLSKQPKATCAADRVNKGQARASKGVPRIDGPRTRSELGIHGKRAAYAKYLADKSDKKRVEKIPGGYVVRDADGHAPVYVYCRDNQSEALQTRVLTENEALRIAISVAKLRRG
jgi:hypothetical protein